MKRKNIDALREIRLWVTNCIVPAAIIAGTLASNPKVREKISTTFENFKAKFHKKYEAD